MSINISKNIFSTLDVSIQNTILEAINKNPKQGKNLKKEKNLNQEKPTKVNAWTAFTKHILATHASEIQAFISEKKISEPQTKVLPLHFVSHYRTNHEEEYNKFQENFKSSQPVIVSESMTVSDNNSVTSTNEKKKRGPKKLVDMTSDERAAHDAKVANRKSAKKPVKTDELTEANEVIFSSAPMVAEPKVAEPKVAEPKVTEPVSAEAKIKPKRIVTDEQKAAMKAGRERAAAAKKALADNNRSPSPGAKEKSE